MLGELLGEATPNHYGKWLGDIGCNLKYPYIYVQHGFIKGSAPAEDPNSETQPSKKPGRFFCRGWRVPRHVG